MDSQMKLGAVLMGGYLLGRTKKGGVALRLASRMMMSGQEASPRELVSNNASKLVQSPETQAILDGLRAQVVAAATAAFDARVQGMAQKLTDKTEAIKAPADKATDTAGQATDVIKGTDDDTDADEEQGDEPSDEEDQEAEGEAEDAEGEDEGAEEGAEGEDEGEEPEDDEAVDAEDEEPEDEEPEDEEPEDEEPEEDDEISERAEELMALRVTSLRRMAKDLRFDPEEVADVEKADLAQWIAEAEAEDAAEEGDDEEPEEPEEPEPVKKPAKKTAKKAPAKKAAKKAPAKKSAAKKTSTRKGTR